MHGEGFFEGCAKRGGVCDCDGRPCGMDLRMDIEGESLIQRVNSQFTEEALKSQDGKTIPLTQEIGGPVIGEATLKYDADEKALKADFRVDDPEVAEFLKGPPPYHIFKKES